MSINLRSTCQRLLFCNSPQARQFYDYIFNNGGSVFIASEARTWNTKYTLNDKNALVIVAPKIGIGNSNIHIQNLLLYNRLNDTIRLALKTNYILNSAFFYDLFIEITPQGNTKVYWESQRR